MVLAHDAYFALSIHATIPGVFLHSTKVGFLVATAITTVTNEVDESDAAADPLLWPFFDPPPNSCSHPPSREARQMSISMSCGCTE